MWTKQKQREQNKTNRVQTKYEQSSNEKTNLTINENKQNWQPMKMTTEPVSRDEALIPDDVILTRSGLLDTSYGDLDDATSSEGR